MNNNYLIKSTILFLLIFCTSVMVFWRLNQNESNENTYSPQEEDHVAAEERIITEYEEFEKHLYAHYAESNFDVATTEEITPHDPVISESFVNGNLKGKWKRAKVKISDENPTPFGHPRGVRTKKTVYDPENHQVFVLSLTGEVFYGASLTQNAGIVPTNPKVVVKSQSFCGVNKPDGSYILCGGINSSSSSGSMFYSEDKGITWKKSGNASYSSIIWATETETNRIVMVCKNSNGTVIKHSTDYGVSYTDLETISGNIGDIKTTRMLNTTDRFEILIRYSDTKAYRYYVYENDTLTKKTDLPNLKIKYNLYSAKIGDSITYSFVADVSPFKLRLYNKDWVQVDSITVSGGHKAQGIVFPFGRHIILSRWLNPRRWEKGQNKWVNFNSKSVGYDAHNLQFFRMKDGGTLMFNNCDNGMRFKVITGLEDVKSTTPAFNYLDDFHYYAELHGGDAHPDGHTVAAYQDNGTLLLMKQTDGTYEAIQLGRPDGLEATINKDGNGVWYRHYWQQCWFHKLEDGVRAKKYTISLDLGWEWHTPQMNLTYVPGEEAIYMGGRKNIIKLLYNSTTDKLESLELPYTFPQRVKTVVATQQNPDRMYVSTHEGRFYYSNDRGVSWTESDWTKGKTYKSSNQNYGGWAGDIIKVPKDKPDWVYFGNNNSTSTYGKCMLSTDGGKTFTNIGAGLENVSRVRDISVSDNGEIAFSTSYHIYVKQLEQWFPIRTDNFINGAVTAKNVVYLEGQNVVRYFTASAGVVDFKIDEINFDVNNNQNSIIQFEVSPQPNTSSLNVSAKVTGEVLPSYTTGFVYGVSFNPSVTDQQVLASVENGYMDTTINGLAKNIEIFVRAFVINGKDTVYSPCKMIKLFDVDLGEFATNIKVYLPLDKDFLDYSNNQHTITVSGSPVLSNDAQINKSMTFDGTDDYLQIPAGILNPSLDDFTFCVWIKPEDNSTDRVILQQENGSGTGRTILHLSNNLFGSFLGEAVYKPTTTYALGSWVHIAMVGKKNKTQMFINGQPEEEFNASIESADGELNIGCHKLSSGNSRNWIGQMDEVYLLNKALSHEEIKKFAGFDISGNPSPILSEVKTYPNPASNTLYVKWSDDTQPERITILDISGKEIITKYPDVFDNQIYFNVSELEEGIYILQVQAGNQISGNKIMINR